MFNQLTLAGRVAQEPVINKTGGGLPWTRLNLAVRRMFKDKDTNEYTTDFFDIVIWASMAEKVCSHVKKGDVVFVKGRIETNVFKTKEGVKVKGIDIIGEQVVFIPTAKTREIESVEETVEE